MEYQYAVEVCTKGEIETGDDIFLVGFTPHSDINGNFIKFIGAGVMEGRGVASPTVGFKPCHVHLMSKASTKSAWMRHQRHTRRMLFQSTLKMVTVVSFFKMQLIFPDSFVDD